MHPKLAVYSHYGNGVTQEKLVQLTRLTCQGPLVVGSDLMTFDMGEGVAVYNGVGTNAAPPRLFSRIASPPTS